MIEGHLTKQISQNFDKFTLAFESFDEIKEDLELVQA